jgi:hypothetical protein
MVILIFDVSGKGIMRLQAQAHGDRDMIKVRQVAGQPMLNVAVPVSELYD